MYKYKQQTLHFVLKLKRNATTNKALKLFSENLFAAIEDVELINDCHTQQQYNQRSDENLLIATRHTNY